MRKLVLSMAIAALCLFAADPSGKWTWEMQTRNGEKRTQTLNLKTDGDKLSGTISGRPAEGSGSGLSCASYHSGSIQTSATQSNDAAAGASGEPA